MNFKCAVKYSYSTKYYHIFSFPLNYFKSLFHILCAQALSSLLHKSPVKILKRYSMKKKIVKMSRDHFRSTIREDRKKERNENRSRNKCEERRPWCQGELDLHLIYVSPPILFLLLLGPREILPKRVSGCSSCKRECGFRWYPIIERFQRLDLAVTSPTEIT